MEYQLSIVIPGRNEEFLARTIQDLIENTSDKTEIIAVLDGAWSSPSIPQNPRVNVIYIPESIGQRAATDLGVRLSRAKYVAKCDAHCSFDNDFDTKMLDGFKKVGDNVTMVPVMRNLHVFNWKCSKCGWKRYQGPTPEKCENCGRTHRLRRQIMWIGKRRPQSTSYCFDNLPHFQYFEDYKHREPYISDKKTGFTETMSLQGSFFMSTREKYWELELGGNFGSWGGQGIQVACATWLSGGKVLVNHSTFYAHLFRTQGGDFGFPYPQSGKHVSRTKKRVWELFKDNKFEKQIHPVSWLVRKFSPCKGWSEDDIKKLEEYENNNLAKKNE